VCGVFLFVYILLGNVERWHAACVGTSMSANHTKRKSNSANIFLAAARRGNHDAFIALISPHASNLRRLARSFTRNAEDAEDVCQQSLLKAFTKLNHFASAKEVATAEFRSWLAKITANSAIDFLRRTRSARMVALEECDPLQKPDADSWGENPEASYARRERSRIILEAVAALPTGLRRVCVLRNLEELSTKEVADRLGLPAVTVRVRLFRAHCELRKRLGVGSQDCEQVRRPSRYVKMPTAESRQRKNPNILMNSANRMNSRAKTATLSLKCPILERQIPISRKAGI
jgi:RNA polymerase sigma-70 factor (ECF subfamily)